MKFSVNVSLFAQNIAMTKGFPDLQSILQITDKLRLSTRYAFCDIYTLIIKNPDKCLKRY